MQIRIVRTIDGGASVWVDVGRIVENWKDKEIVVEAARELQREIIRYEAKEQGRYGRRLDDPSSNGR